MPGIIRTVSNFLFSTANRELLIFLAFLLLSGSFWLTMTLNETYTREVTIGVHITHVPKNVIITSGQNDSIRATISDKGFNLLPVIYGLRRQHLEVDFERYAEAHGTGRIANTDLRRLLEALLPASVRVESVKPDKLTFFYNYGERKKVPVVLQARITPQNMFFISKKELSPDSVVIYASRPKLDSIKHVSTEIINRTDVHDTLVVNTRLQSIPGVKMVPNNVTVRVYADVLTEESIDNVPIEGINMPKGKILRTFPAKVTVRFVTGMKNYRRLTQKDFLVVADYNEFSKSPSSKCAITLLQKPDGVTRATLSVTQVDYLIEEQY